MLKCISESNCIDRIQNPISITFICTSFPKYSSKEYFIMIFSNCQIQKYPQVVRIKSTLIFAFTTRHTIWRNLKKINISKYNISCNKCGKVVTPKIGKTISFGAFSMDFTTKSSTYMLANEFQRC
jgi:hypothetical protein